MYDGLDASMQVEKQVINFFNDWSANPGMLDLGYKVKHHYSSGNHPFTYKSSDELVNNVDSTSYILNGKNLESKEDLTSTEKTKSENKKKDSDDDDGSNGGNSGEGSSSNEETPSAETEVDTTSVEDTVNSIVAELFDFN